LACWKRGAEQIYRWRKSLRVKSVNSNFGVELAERLSLALMDAQSG
jgi:hypothetical protein